ncbi:MAG: thioredoxin [Bacteroidaceae bacterium]|nr:thioredoxin [Bacteroidaceae bacterium]MBQ3992580.1 thioredoxin [Bacteroidaceae bacterium]
MAQKITSENFQALVNTGKPIMLDFWATWCGPCRMVGPVIEELAKEYEGKAIIGKCDIEEDEELPQRFGIRNIPTILFIKNGEVVDKQVGAAGRAVFEDKLKAIL